ncbi:MAG: tetratricopeptide repeat protein, partial [Thermodesulfovibrionales bacterium]
EKVSMIPVSKAEDLYYKAERLYNEGNVEESVNHYLQALQEDPNYLDALINLSVTLIELNKHQDAKMYLERALRLDRDNHIVLTNYANVLYSLNRIDDALHYYHKALSLNPQSVEIKKNIVQVLISKEMFEDAIVYLNQLISAGVTQKDVFIKLGHCLSKIKRHQDALKTMLLCYRIYPKDPEVITIIGTIFENLGDDDRAEACYRQAVRFGLTNHIHYFNLARILKKKGLYEEAVYFFKRSVEIKSDFLEGLLELGNTYKHLKRYKEALDTYMFLHGIVPNSYLVLNNIGTTYYEMKSYDRALIYLNKAINLKPDFAPAYFNRGLVFKDTFDLNSAIDDYQSAIRLNYEYPEAHWNLGLILLSKGDLEQGFKHYEWRKRLTLYEPYKRQFKGKEWNNEDLYNKTILLHDEQGFGDAIQFVRYAKILNAMGARVILECLQPLVRLFGYADGVDSVIARGHELPDFDFYCSLLTLPLRFNTKIETIPNDVPYIRPPIPAAISKGDKRVKIGIAWSGINPPHKSCPLDIFFRIFKDIADIHIYNLQKIITDTDREFIISRGVVDVMQDVSDFLDTANIMRNLDLIITIDTSIAHLGGAMGLRVWTLLHYDADWRWLTAREDSPWYPTMRLFRQKSYGDWDSLVKRVNEYLSETISSSIT